MQGAASVDPVAADIGAVNTLVRQPDGSLRGYNTDWEAAIQAIERALGGGGPEGAAGQSSAGNGSNGGGALSPLSGRMVVVVGAGGAGRAIAFGAAQRGAKVRGNGVNT